LLGLLQCYKRLRWGGVGDEDGGKKGSGGAGTDIHMFVDGAGVEVAWLWARLKCKSEQYVYYLSYVMLYIIH
jgi:hypothetical protein